MKFLVAVFICLMFFIVACCGGNSSPVTPVFNGQDTSGGLTLTTQSDASGSSRILWGYYNIILDGETNEAEIVPLRTSMFNANVTQFLSPPFSPVSCIVIKILPGSDFPSGYLNIDITLTHPFPGTNMYQGFDVRGIFMADGATSSSHDPDILYSLAANGEAELLNEDGYTRWWNSTEFTDSLPILSYTPGPLGSVLYPSATLNPYKYFADDISYDGDVGDLPVESRGVFSSDQSDNKRNYQLQFPVIGSPQFEFNYAVDASWELPDPAYAPDYPVEAFPAGAQCQEAYHLSVNTSGTTAWYEDGNSGGSVNLVLEVFDWQALSNLSGVVDEIATIWLESPVLSSPINILPLAIVSTGSQTTSSVFEVELTGGDLNLTASGTFSLMGSVESAVPATYQPQIDGGENFIFPNGPLAAYFMGTMEISSEPPSLTLIKPNGSEIWFIGSSQEIQWTGGIDIDSVKLEYSKDDFNSDIHTIIGDTPNDGLFTWTPIPDDPSETVKVRVFDAGYPGNYDDSDNYFTIEEPSTGWALVFPDPPVQLSDSGGEGWDNDAPRLIEDGQNRLVVSWAQNRSDQPDVVDARQVDRISLDLGDSWDPMDSFQTSTYDREGCLWGTKMALDGNGDAYALDFWYDETGPFITMWCNFLIRCPFDDEEDWGWQTSMSVHGVELAFTEDGYPLCFEDYDLLPGYTGIQVAKGLWQNSPMGLQSGQWNKHSWWKIGQYYQVAEDPVGLSTGPSIQRDAYGTIWLAYQNGPLTADQILMVHNTDPSMEFWSSPTLVYEAVSPYEHCNDPTLWLDTTGGMHLAYIRSTSSEPPEYSLVYLSAPSGDPNDFGSEEICINAVTEIGYPTIQTTDLPIGLTPLTLLDSGDGITFATWRNPIDGNWSDPIQVDINSESTTPAMWVDQDMLYVHVVWSEPDSFGFNQIWYRRGQFIEL